MKSHLQAGDTVFAGTLICGFMVLIAGPSHFASASDSGDSPTSRGNCGRDCAYLVCNSLHVPRTLEEIDHQLGARKTVSVADLRAVFEDAGLTVASARVAGRDLGELCKRLSTLKRSARGILVLPAKAGTDGHFVVLEECLDGLVTISDRADGTGTRLSLETLRELDVPVVVVGSPEAVSRIMRAAPPLDSSLMFDFLSSNWMAIVLLASCGAYAVFVLLSRLQFARRSLEVVRRLHANRAGSSGLFRVRRTAVIMISCGIAGAFALTVSLPATPVLHISPQVVDLGHVPMGSEQTLRVDIHNSSSRPVTIRDIKVSCSCLAIDVSQRVVKARESVVATASLQVASPGDAEQQFLIVPEGRAAPVPIRVRYTAVEAATLMPVSVNAGSFPVGVQSQRTVVLKVANYMGEPKAFQAARFVGNADGLAVEFSGTPELRPGGEVTLRLIWSPQQVGRLKQRLVLETKDPRRSFVVTVYGHAIPAIACEPRSVFLGGPAGASMATVKLVSTSSPLRIESIRSEPDVLEASLADASDDRLELTLHVVAKRAGSDTEATSQPMLAKLLVKTQSPIEDVLEVPVFVNYFGSSAADVMQFE